MRLSLLIWIVLITGLHMQNLYGQYYLDYMQQHPDQNFYEIKAAVEEYYADKDKGRGSGYKQFRRWAILMEPYFYPTGEMFNVSAYLYQSTKKFERSQREQQRAMHGYWEEVGPLEYTPGNGTNGGNGRVNRITVHPNSSSALYISTPSGGVWKTENGGVTWTPINDALPSIGASGFAIDYDNPSTMYMLTGDGDGNNAPSVGVLKTFDGGLTWHKTGLDWTINWDFPNLTRAYNLVMHPEDPDILFVAATNGIWRTANGGDLWTQVFSLSASDIEFHPTNPDTMYASGGNFFRSVTGGTSWYIEADPDFPTQYSRIEVGVTPDEPDYVYLLFGGHVLGTGNGTFSGLYRSTDTGLDFSLRSNTPNILGYATNGQDSANQAGYDLAIAVDPLEANVVYVGGINVWKSADGGSSWTIISHFVEPGNTIGYTHADIHTLEIFDGTLYCGSDGGIFSSADGGSTWNNLSDGLGIMQFYRLDVAGEVYAGGTQDNGCNQGSISSTVANHSIGGDGFACLIDYTNTNIRYQSSHNIRYRSLNGGVSFSNIGVPGLDWYSNSAWIMDPAFPDILFMGHTDIWYTAAATDPYVSWTALNAGFSGTKKVGSLAQGVNDRHRLYASDWISLRTSDNVLTFTPATFTDISAGLPVAQAVLSDIAVNPANASQVWVSFQGVSVGNKVFFSPNAGQTWYNASGSLPNVPVNCIIYEPGSANGVYIGTDIGMFYRDDNTVDWLYFGNGLPNVRVFDLDIEGSTLYAATFGRGVWKSPLYSTCPFAFVLTPENDPSNPYATGVQIYRAGSYITSSRIITGGLGTDVKYFAGNEITLTDGFHCKADNAFEVRLEGCPE